MFVQLGTYLGIYRSTETSFRLSLYSYTTPIIVISSKIEGKTKTQRALEPATDLLTKDAH